MESQGSKNEKLIVEILKNLDNINKRINNISNDIKQIKDKVEINTIVQDKSINNETKNWFFI
jgi:predicted  nucleic acid-binding Zn-ribbon protein